MHQDGVTIHRKCKNGIMLYFSCPERSLSAALYILLYGSAAAVILLTLCGNLLVIVSVFHFKQLHTPTNMLVLSLAVSDFLVGALTMPLVFIWAIESCWIFSSAFCMYFMIMYSVLGVMSIYQVALISVDRYFALSNPFLYMNRVSVRMIRVIISLQWCVIMGYSITFLYFNGNLMNFPSCPGECIYFVNGVFSFIDLVIIFVFPCSVIIIFYTGVFVIAKRHANAIRELSNLTRAQTHTDRMKSERKAAKVLSILVSVFLICLLPYFIYSLLGGVIEQTRETVNVLLIVICINSTINPVIYALFHHWFRKCVKIIITLKIFQAGSSLMNVLS